MLITNLCKHEMWINLVNFNIAILILVNVNLIGIILMIMVGTWDNQCAYSDSQCYHDFQLSVQLEAKSSWELAIERLANGSKPSWEETIERLTNEFGKNLERLANVIFDRFAGIESRIDQLTLYFGKIHEQLHELCEVISSNSMQFASKDNGTGITCGSDLCLECDHDVTSNSCDNVFGSNIETQEVTLNDVYITPLEDCLVPIGSKDMIEQGIPVAYPLVSSQVTYGQGNTH